MGNRIYNPLEGPDRWEGIPAGDVPVSKILPQADLRALERIKKMDPNDEWVQHLLSLEKYKDEEWRNPIVIWEGSDADFDFCPSGRARKPKHKYIIAIGYNRHYWSVRWGRKTIKAIICSDYLQAHSFRSLSEVDKKVERFGIERTKGNLILPMEMMEENELIRDGRFAQWVFPRFKFDPKRIVERIRGEDWKNLTGKYRVVRPMPGERSHNSKFYQIAGEPPVIGEEFVACVHPEGWINMERDFKRYWNIFREL